MWVVDLYGLVVVYVVVYYVGGYCEGGVGL